MVGVPAAPADEIGIGLGEGVEPGAGFRGVDDQLVIVPGRADEPGDALAVDGAEIGGLGGAALFVADRFGRLAGDAARRQPVQVLAVLESLRHAPVAGDVRRGPELHRAVVAADIDEAILRLEQRPEGLVARRLLDIGASAGGSPAGRGRDAVAGMDAPGHRRDQRGQRLAEAREHLVGLRQCHQCGDGGVMRGFPELAAGRRELARFLGALPAAQLFARQHRLEQGALGGRRLRQVGGQLGHVHLGAGGVVGDARLEPPGLVSLHERGVCGEVEPDAAMAQAHHGGGDADLDFVSARLTAQRRQDALREAEGHDGV